MVGAPGTAQPVKPKPSIQKEVTYSADQFVSRKNMNTLDIAAITAKNHAQNHPSLGSAFKP